MKILILLLFFTTVEISYSQESFITSTGRTYSEARDNASKLIFSQNLKIIGQNHTRDLNGNWTLILKVRPKYN